MQEVRIRVEHVHIIALGRKRICLPKVQRKVSVCKIRGRSRKRERYWFTMMPVFIALALALAIYGVLALMAYVTRGYFALGGESLFAIVVGFFTYETLLHI